MFTHLRSRGGGGAGGLTAPSKIWKLSIGCMNYNINMFIHTCKIHSVKNLSYFPF